MTMTAQAFTPEERRTYVGASEFAAVLGLDKYRTPLDVWNEKTGRVAPFEGNKHTERGNRLEAVAADEYSILTGSKLRRRNEGLVHPDYPFIRGHVDRVVVGEKRIVEIKAPSVAAFRAFQRNGLPDSYILQAHAYLGLTGYDKLTYCIFCADQWDIASFDVSFDAGIYAAAVEQVKNFWVNYVMPDIAPPAIDADKPALEFEKIGGDVIRMDDDEEFRTASFDLREAAVLKADADQLYELAKQRVIDVIGGQPGRYEGPGFRLSYLEQAGRKTFDQKALKAAHPELDLEPFYKQGNPFKVFKPYFIGE